MVASKTPVPRSSTTATRSATRPARAGSAGLRDRGFRALYIRPLFCEGRARSVGGALWDPKDIGPPTRRCSNCSRQRPPAPLDPRRPGPGGLPGAAGAHLLARLRRARRGGLRFNELVASGEVSAPIVIGRDHLDCGSVASPYRETEPWPTGPTPLRTGPLERPREHGQRATWVSIHHGGEWASAGRSTPAGQRGDGTELAAQKLERVLTNDPGMGVIRHVDAGYPTPSGWRRARVRIPMHES